MYIGIDIGSTTIKCAVFDNQKNLILKFYHRHFSQIKQKTLDALNIIKKNLGDISAKIAISGSAGMGIAQNIGIPFVQEVYATKIASDTFLKDTDVIIELGGEDAKILFLSNGLEVRMNGSCAGGTGAFIDQMASLLGVSTEDINQLAASHSKIYTIASRCGVFAKSDIQPLLNQGACKNDIAASIFHAVANQTVSGLAQGRKIAGNVVYLGGPLTFMSQLRETFDKTLGVSGHCPENSLYFVAMGSALYAKDEFLLTDVIKNVEKYTSSGEFSFNKPLFENKSQYENFLNRHNINVVPKGDINKYSGKVFLGIDAGSTTVKAAVIGEDNQLLASSYLKNDGNPIPLIKNFLLDFYKSFPNLKISSCAVTGYGEELLKNAFNIDYGIVETIAHLTAAQKFVPDVDFIIDIGGQDIKCFKVKNGIIDNIFLNEACSSGCGSFLQTFANSLGYSIEDFAKLGLFAKKPVELGSRCTVFMNSSVKQAQKDGATVEDISAGLSLSVVKNALYKVIRTPSREDLGKKIVVQGGTFLNNAVLRAFERELDTNVVRPDIAGLMGAFGAALYAKKFPKEKSSLISLDELSKLSHDIKNTVCKGCSNNCKLTINIFDDKRKFISGNRCEKPISNKCKSNDLNMYQIKLNMLKKYSDISGTRETIGIPLVLNMYELLPFWHTFFSYLGFGIKVSPFSTREIYLLGQHTIPSDTVCFPAKLAHGHIEYLIQQGVSNIFYPCMSYNLNENLGDNHYNCPVVAYYPELLEANILSLSGINFINDYVGLHRPKEFPEKICAILQKYFKGISLKDVDTAAKHAYLEYENHMKKIQQSGLEIISKARSTNKKIIVLAGRPYHIDPEINHGIDKLISSFDAAIVSEDALVGLIPKCPTTVLNQWTYHSRLYNAAHYVKNQKDMDLIQLVSFGCGTDAVTTDEIREILEKSNKIYTQLKIDEITNLGTVKIRIRSLFAANSQEK